MKKEEAKKLEESKKAKYINLQKEEEEFDYSGYPSSYECGHDHEASGMCE